MFESLSDRLSGIFDKLTRRGALSEADVDAALREVRRALIEADVALEVVRSFIDKVRARAVGEEVIKSVTPGQMVVKIVHDQLVEMLGATAEPIDLNAAPPVAIMMVGLQGSGKTTTTAKIARRLTLRDKRKVLMVVDAMTGQDAVNAAAAFAERVDFDGVIVTKLDGDARGGAALSVRAVTGKPIKFAGTGEKLDALEPFHPERMAKRILGMGDVVTLIERAQESIDTDTAADLESRLASGAFTLDDFLAQLQQVKKMGSIGDLLAMIPGMGGKVPKDVEIDESALVRTEAIIRSMTATERAKPSTINGSRRERIANGAGVRVFDVNQVLKQFSQAQKMVKQLGQMQRGGKRKRFPGMPGMPGPF
jgi:signal recognition particle GTPase